MLITPKDIKHVFLKQGFGGWVISSCSKMQTTTVHVQFPNRRDVFVCNLWIDSLTISQERATYFGCLFCEPRFIGKCVCMPEIVV